MSNLDKENVPIRLRPLIYLAEKWGISDDGLRNEAIEEASPEELKNFVEEYTDEVVEELDNWFSNYPENKFALEVKKPPSLSHPILTSRIR